MLSGVVRAVRRVLDAWSQPRPLAALQEQTASAVQAPTEYRPLEHVVLTDGVSRTLFEEYAEHRHSERGDEETGWVLMGLRHEKEAIALATLPAGAKREAGVAHVRFNADAQALASRILRQEDRRLTILGIVHTHPGSLRHPSSGDLEGDREWVKLLRGGEGVFGIGTTDAGGVSRTDLAANQPKPHVLSYQGLRFTWYALGVGAQAYRRVSVRVTIGPDLAYPLHGLWPTIERHAERLDRLCRQLARVRFEVMTTEDGPALQVLIPLAKDRSLAVVLQNERVQYCLVRKDQWLVSDNQEAQVDRGVYLMLAALADH